MFRYRNKIEVHNSGDEQDVYCCSRCNAVLFNSRRKFNVGSGFPSFWEHVGNNVKQQLLSTYGRERIQLLCTSCGQHLGHLFKDNRTPSNVRYCIHGAALAHHKH